MLALPEQLGGQIQWAQVLDTLLLNVANGTSIGNVSVFPQKGSTSSTLWLARTWRTRSLRASRMPG